MNLKAKDIHFLNVSEKETISCLVVLYEPEFFLGLKANCP